MSDYSSSTLVRRNESEMSLTQKSSNTKNDDDQQKQLGCPRRSKKDRKSKLPAVTTIHKLNNKSPIQPYQPKANNTEHKNPKSFLNQPMMTKVENIMSASNSPDKLSPNKQFSNQTVNYEISSKVRSDSNDKDLKEIDESNKSNSQDSSNRRKNM